MKCCARCKTPGFGCVNGACACHNLLRTAQARQGLEVFSPLTDTPIIAALEETPDA